MWIEDLCNAVRGLRSAPGFTATAVISLGLGIGGSVAMFTVVNSILLKPLAYQDADRLVRVSNAYAGSYSDIGVLPLEFTRWRNQIQSLESIALVASSSTGNLIGMGRPELLNIMRISAGYF